MLDAETGHPKYDKKQDASGMLLCCHSKYFFGLSSGPYRSMKYGQWMYIHYLITGPRLDSHPPKIEVQCAAARFQCKGSPGVPGIMCRTMCIHNESINESILCEFDVLHGPTYILTLHDYILMINHQTFQVPKMEVLTYISCM